MADNKYQYQFVVGFALIEKGEADFRYMRLRGKELAAQLGKPVSLRVHNEYLGRWQALGTDYPDGTCINSFGDIMVLDEDGNNYKIIGKTHKLTK